MWFQYFEGFLIFVYQTLIEVEQPERFVLPDALHVERPIVRKQDHIRNLSCWRYCSLRLNITELEMRQSCHGERFRYSVTYVTIYACSEAQLASDDVSFAFIGDAHEAAQIE